MEVRLQQVSTDFLNWRLKTVKTRFLVALMFVGLMTVGSSSAQNLINNAGFETGDFTGWSIFNGQDPYDDTFVAGCGWSAVCPNSGDYQALFGSVDEPRGISQDINTTAGNTYEVSFWLANDGGSPQSITISFAGVPLVVAGDSNGYGYTFFDFLVTASGSVSSFEVAAYNEPAYYSLDDVAVVETPEPASLVLLGSALSFGAGFIRKVRS
jgi:hypothetical protein